MPMSFTNRIVHHDQHFLPDATDSIAHPTPATTPLDKIASRIANLAPEDCLKQKVVLLLTGSFCPIHLHHTDILEAAKVMIESSDCNMTVLAGFLSPSHDHYVGEKLRGANIVLDSHQRLALCRAQTKQSSWIDVDPWEATQNRFHDYHQVTGRLSTFLNQECKKLLAARLQAQGFLVKEENKDKGKEAKTSQGQVATKDGNDMSSNSPLSPKPMEVNSGAIQSLSAQARTIKEHKEDKERGEEQPLTGPIQSEQHQDYVLQSHSPQHPPPQSQSHPQLRQPPLPALQLKPLHPNGNGNSNSNSHGMVSDISHPGTLVASPLHTAVPTTATSPTADPSTAFSNRSSLSIRVMYLCGADFVLRTGARNLREGVIVVDRPLKPASSGTWRRSILLTDSAAALGRFSQLPDLDRVSEHSASDQSQSDQSDPDSESDHRSRSSSTSSNSTSSNSLHNSKLDHVYPPGRRRWNFDDTGQDDDDDDDDDDIPQPNPTPPQHLHSHLNHHHHHHHHPRRHISPTTTVVQERVYKRLVQTYGAEWCQPSNQNVWILPSRSQIAEQDISSTLIRDLLGQQKSCEGLLHPRVSELLALQTDSAIQVHL